jgi:hypothetical protein
LTIEKSADPVPPPRPAPARTPEWKRKLAAISRWLHIYLSMASFAILFFFAVTGLTLNHPDWFDGRQSTTQHQGTVDARWLAGGAARLEIVEHLRRTHRITAALGDFRLDDTQCAASFKGPGYAADVFLDRATGKYELSETRMGFVAVINDLHKGRDSGKAWSAVIDLSAILMTLVSLSGFLLIFFLQRRRSAGLMAAAIGLAVSYAVYVTWVP